MKKADFQTTFNKLKSILKMHENALKIISNKSDSYYLNASYSEKFKRDLNFGGVEIKKSYVSYHLMPVYVNPQLLDGISPELKKRMQGKSCFNFKGVDDELFYELSQLTKKGFEYYKKNRML